MAAYISSIANRYYCATEQEYGTAATIRLHNRFPAMRLHASQTVEQTKRYDKTGSRSFRGFASSGRRHSGFQVRTYLCSWDGTPDHSYGPLFQAALGSVDPTASDLTIAKASGLLQLQMAMPHHLTPGSAVATTSEIRFVASTPDPATIVLNAPLSDALQPGDLLTPAATYRLSTGLSSVTLYDYWDPVTTVSRVVTGAAVDEFRVSINGDYHEFTFSGPAADVLDSATFSAGTAGLPSFPNEPTVSNFDYSIVPGHLGQAWLGSTARQFFSIAEATLDLKNNIAMRSNEFGSSLPRAAVPGPRQVSATFTVYVQDDAPTVELYSAAKQRSPMGAMLQLGQSQTQLMGIYLPQVVPELPEFEDSESRLRWRFANNLAQGTSDDELYIAFA